MEVSPPSGLSSGLHISFNDNTNIQMIKDKISKLTCQEINDGLAVQIGSKSEEAYIYKFIIDNHEIVVKIPKQHYHKKQEYEFASYLSNKYPKYFIVVFDQKTCPINLDNTRYETELIFMELVLGDLKQIISDGITELDLFSYIRDVIECVALMAKEGIYHNDLHIGNVFVKFTNRHKYAVIGDFGKSEDSQYLSSSIEDVKRFFRSLRDGLKEMGSPKYLIKISDQINKFYLEHLIPISRPYHDSGERWSSAQASELILKIRDEWLARSPFT